MVVHILLWPACQVVVISCSSGGQSSGGTGDLGAMLVARWRSCRWARWRSCRSARWRSRRERKRTISYHILQTACDVNPFMHLMLLVLVIRR